MNRKILFWGVIFISILLLFSAGVSAAFKPSLVNETIYEKNKKEVSINKETIDGRSLLKNLFFGRNKDLQLNLFSSTVNTVCDDVEKTSEIVFGLYNKIDVDNNENTGVNGKDIQVQYLILPYILPTPDFTIGALITVGVKLLGDEIEDSSFSLSAVIADNLISVGYESPQGPSNKIPNSIQLSSLIFFQPSKQTTGFTFNMNPTYESGQAEKQIFLSAGVNDENVQRTYRFGFQPATETQITICSTLDPNKWEYTFTRDTSFDTTFTAEITKAVEGITKQTTLTIDSLPEEISFSLALTPFSSEGGSIQYQSETMYDVSVLVETNDIGRCKYALIKNTPRELSAEWIPSRENGFYHVSIDSDGTSIYLLNSLNTPTINLSIRELSTVDLTAFWNLTNPGNFEVFKDPSLHIDLDILFDEWEAELDAEPTAEHIYFSWKSNVSGFLNLDTDQLPLSNIDLLVKGPENGISILGETLTADDFHLEWTVWPLTEFYVDKTGSLTFLSLSIDVYVNDQWYHLWPLF
jgi:hypothetical protein